MTCLLKILLSERMDKLEYHPYLTLNSVCEVPAKFPRYPANDGNSRVTCFSTREYREKLGTKNNATWRKRRMASGEDYVLCHQLPNKNGIFDLNYLPKMLSLAL